MSAATKGLPGKDVQCLEGESKEFGDWHDFRDKKEETIQL